MFNESQLLGTQPVQSFFPSLIKEPLVNATLQEYFEERTANVVNKLTAQLPLAEDELTAHDIIVDLILNESEQVEQIEALGDYDDTFCITILKFGSAFWIEAAEFDNIGFFDTYEKAKDCARLNYEPFIKALSNRADENK